MVGLLNAYLGIVNLVIIDMIISGSLVFYSIHAVYSYRLSAFEHEDQGTDKRAFRHRRDRASDPVTNS